ncbi:hypothetical protein E6O75_ATG08374 [Venturia nashicola]|uniref:Uncharacterized protein n=1 Tax=Venturia nashicola TaxID=86259 RepID=A0A4Z1NK39_9PEZI|nr:hypothetical protein E6O75_ATG08374 [Venturia nashicola]
MFQPQNLVSSVWNLVCHWYHRDKIQGQDTLPEEHVDCQDINTILVGFISSFETANGFVFGQKRLRAPN